jgi:hypothetical protein
MQRSSAAGAGVAKEKIDPMASLKGSVPDKPEIASTGVCRTTAVFPLALNENWEAFALKTGVAKNEVLITALKQYLTRQGLQPDRRPRLEVTY